MLALLLRLVTMRIGPQDLPYSPALTRTLVVALAVLEIGYALLLDLPGPLPRLLLSIGLLLGWPWLLLSLRDRRPRYAQTLAALAGSGVLFTLLMLPLALLVSGEPTPDPALPPEPRQVLLGWAVLLLLGWKLMVEAHIYRHALDWPRLSALLIVLSMFMIEFGLFSALFAEPA